MLLLSFIHTLAIHAPLPIPTTGAVCPREVFGLAHKQSSRSASTPQRCTRTGCIRAVLGLISKCKLALSVGIVQCARQVRRKLDWFVGFVQQTLTWKWIKKKEKKEKADYAVSEFSFKRELHLLWANICHHFCKTKGLLISLAICKR